MIKFEKEINFYYENLILQLGIYGFHQFHYKLYNRPFRMPISILFSISFFFVRCAASTSNLYSIIEIEYRAEF